MSPPSEYDRGFRAGVEAHAAETRAMLRRLVAAQASRCAVKTYMKRYGIGRFASSKGGT